jgi:glycosyltransferase involved in cell wall biosynthesis
MRRVILARKPDVVIGFMHSMYVPLGLAMIGAGVPVVASEHTGRQHFSTRPLQRLLVRLLSRLFVAKSVPSEVIRRDRAAEESLPVVVLPNPLAVDEFAAGATTAPADPPVLLSVGRFMEEKNQLELIAAFAALAADYPQWTLRFAGDGEMRAELEQAVAARGLAARVQMPGAVSDMAGEYARAAVVAMPSRWEAFGLATAEALASSRPVIGFADCPGTNELIQDGTNGVLVEGGPQRVFHLEQGLRRLMADPALRARLGAAGPASVRQFSVQEVAHRWETFLLDCGSGGIPGAESSR